MATINAIDSNIPIAVSQGGTGNSTLLAHGVLVGEGTSPLNALAVGSTGTLLVGSTSADPAFATSANGNFTFTSSTASQTRTLTVINTDNTAAATSAANVQITVGGTNVGDPQTTYTVTGSTNWSEGIDNSASGVYKLAASTALGTTDTFIMSTAGSLNMPLQPCFAAYNSTTQSNVTGDGTSYNILFDTTLFDQATNFSSSTFTAPIAGNYLFTATVAMSVLATTHTSASATLLVAGNGFALFGINPGAAKTAASTLTLGGSVLAAMTAGSTAIVAIQVTGGTKTVDLVNGIGGVMFTGALLC